MTTDDMELVREYAAHHSESAFATLVSRHTSLVYSAALRQVRNPQLAEEVTQVVFTILARKAGSLDSKTILSGWLYRTTCYVSGSALKRELRRQHREQEAHIQSNLRETEADPTWKQLSPLLDEAMLQLGQTDRNALVLRFFEGRSLKEVGVALGGSEDAAKKRVTRALEKLRKFFTKHGVPSTAAIIAGVISANSVQAAPIGLAKTATAAALANSLAASSSTLPLINSTLKLMAWTKTKMAIVAGVGVLVTAGITTSILWSQRQPVQGIPKDWSALSGSIDQWQWVDEKITAHSTNFDTILASQKTYRDVSLSVVASSTNREASLAIRMQDAGNGYVLIFAPAGTSRENAGEIILVKRQSGEETTLATYKGRVFSSLGSSAKISVNAKGPWIEAGLNDTPVIRAQDNTFTSGFIGLRIYGDGDSPCDATYSNLTFH